MLGTTTPIEISEDIVKFCAGIDPSQVPVFLTLQPNPKAILSECFANVQEHIKENGGSIQLGWVIWETPGIMLEGMFHAVWRSPEGKLVDVTPQMDGERQLLFLPDSAATIHKESGDHVAILRMPLVDDPLLHEYIRLGDSKDALKVRTQGRLTMSEVAEMARIEMREIPLERELALKYHGRVDDVGVAPPVLQLSDGMGHPETIQRKAPKVGRNERCPCGSGKKYKKCCGI